MKSSNNKIDQDKDLSSEQMSEEMRARFEAETGKKAIWHGTITENYKKWMKGEKIYPGTVDKNISFSLSNDLKSEMQEFVKKHNRNLSEFSRFSIVLAKFIIERLFILKANLRFEDIFKLIKDILEKQLFLNSEIAKSCRESLTPLKGYINLTQTELEITFKKIENNLSNEVDITFLKNLISTEKLKFINLLDEVLKHEKALENKIESHFKDRLEPEKEYDILIIDDDETVNTLISAFYKARNKKVKAFNNPKDALIDIKSSKPKAILLDIDLPDIQGKQVCKRIKSSNDFKDIIVYFFTATAIDDVGQLLQETEANGIIYKPYDDEDLEKILTEVKNKD